MSSSKSTPFSAGLCAVHQFVRIGRHAMIGGMSGVERDVIPYGQVIGDRARLIGLNIIGMQRRGFTREDIQALRNAYQFLFHSRGHLERPGRRDRRALCRDRPGRRHHPIHPRRFEPRHLSAEGVEWRIARAANRSMADKLGIVAGAGGLPRRLVEACRETGRGVFVLALEGAAEPETVADVAACLVPDRRRRPWPRVVARKRRRRAGAGRRGAAAVARLVAAGLARRQILRPSRLPGARR